MAPYREAFGKGFKSLQQAIDIKKETMILPVIEPQRLEGFKHMVRKRRRDINFAAGKRDAHGAGMKMKPGRNIDAFNKCLSAAVFPVAQNGRAERHRVDPQLMCPPGQGLKCNPRGLAAGPVKQAVMGQCFY